MSPPDARAIIRHVNGPWRLGNRVRTIVGVRLYGFEASGSMGVVRNVRFISCYWPHLDGPVPLFARGSRNLTVIGVPTPRNVVFPDDTVFPEYHPDAMYPAEQAVKRMSPGRAGIVNLTDEEAAAYVAAYEEAVAGFPDHYTKHRTRGDCHFLRGKDGVIELTRTDVENLLGGRRYG